MSGGRPEIRSGAAALWASAFVIMALTLVQAGRLTGGPGSPGVATAGDVSEIRDLTILTAAGGNEEDILVILDRRSEGLYIYGVHNRNSVELFQTYDLSGLFSEARRAAGLGGVRR